MWLTGRLVPDHKTIADFRKDNGGAIVLAFFGRMTESSRRGQERTSSINSQRMKSRGLKSFTDLRSWRRDLLAEDGKLYSSYNHVRVPSFILSGAPILTY
jgi:hypothetical protein